MRPVLWRPATAQVGEMVEVAVVGKDGNHVWLMVRLAEVTEESNTTYRCLNADITEYKWRFIG